MDSKEQAGSDASCFFLRKCYRVGLFIRIAEATKCVYYK
jgi:hypothetical protein